MCPREQKIRRSPGCCEWVWERLLKPSEHWDLVEFMCDPSMCHKSPEVRIQNLGLRFKSSMVFGLQLVLLKILLAFIECCKISEYT